MTSAKRCRQVGYRSNCQAPRWTSIEIGAMTLASGGGSTHCYCDVITKASAATPTKTPFPSSENQQGVRTSSITSMPISGRPRYSQDLCCSSRFWLELKRSNTCTDGRHDKRSTRGRGLSACFCFPPHCTQLCVYGRVPSIKCGYGPKALLPALMRAPALFTVPNHRDNSICARQYQPHYTGHAHNRGHPTVVASPRAGWNG